MKILNVNTSLDPVTGGGGTERTFQMSKSLVKRRLECTILTTDLGLTQQRINDLAGVRLIALPCVSTRFFLPKFSFKQIKKIVGQVDIIHFMSHWSLLNALVYFMARYLKKPYVVCPGGALPAFGRSKLVKSVYNFFVGKSLVRNAAGHVAIAENETEQFEKYGVDANRITFIPNGINGEDYVAHNDVSFRKKHGLGDDPFILFVGRLNAIKGPDLLLKAFCNVRDQLPGYHLLFVGPDGGMLDELKQIALDARADAHVHFIGYLGGTDKSEAYHAADLLAIPSRQEAMSIVVLEAGISGTPVLLSDQCGFNVIENIDGGRVVPASVEGFEQGLVDILGCKEKLNKMGKCLQQYTVEHFTWDSIIGKYLALYKQILDEPITSN